MVMKNSIQKTGDGSLSCNLVIKVLVLDYPHQKVSSKWTGLFYFCNTVNFVINIADGKKRCPDGHYNYLFQLRNNC